MNEQVVIPNTWKILPFKDCIEKKGSKIEKVQRRNYLKKGKYPIIDQGKEYVAGFTNEAGLIYRGKLPVIVFGDHTRIFKYIAFPFVAGADGTQIILPNEKILDSKFFYYKLIDTKITNRGYSRHFSLLKEKYFEVPPFVEQHGIAEVLGTVDEAINMTDAVIEKVNELKRGLMQRLLNKGIGHTEFKQTELGKIPIIWDVIKIGNLTRVTNGSTPKRTTHEYWENGTIPWITTTQVNDKYITKAEEYITQLGFQNTSLKILPKNTVLVSMIGQGKNRGKAALLQLDGATTNQNFAAIPPSPKLDPYFLLFYLENNYQQIRALGRGSNQDALNCKIVQSIKIPLPEIIEQKNISSIIIGCENKLVNEQIQKEKLKVIKNGLMHNLLSGRVRVRLDKGGLHRIRDS